MRVVCYALWGIVDNVLKLTCDGKESSDDQK